MSAGGPADIEDKEPASFSDAGSCVSVFLISKQPEAALKSAVELIEEVLLDGLDVA